MRKALPGLAAGFVAVAIAAACGNVNTPVAVTPTPSATPTASLTPTPTGTATASPTPGSGTGILRLDIQCSGVGCINGDLIAQVVDCTPSTAIYQHDSRLNLTPSMGTIYPIWLSGVAPGFPCVHVFLDADHDGVKNNGDKAPFFDPQQVSVAATGTSANGVIISN